MRYRNYRKKGNKKARYFFIAGGIFAFVLFIFIQINNILAPVVQTYARYQSLALATRVINDAVLKVLEEENISYTSMVNIAYNPEGEILSVQANSMSANHIKAVLTNAIAQNLEELQYEDIAVPFGTLTQIQILNGRGPKVHFRVKPASYVVSQITSTLETAGINQVRHMINLVVKVKMDAVIPGYSTAVEIEVEVPLAELLIVGHVPDTFASLGGAITEIG